MNITIPKSWDDLTIQQYLNYMRVLRDFTPGLDMNSNQAQLLNMNLIEVICNVSEDELDKLSLDEFMILNEGVAKFIANNNYKIVFTNKPDVINIDDIDYVVRNYNSISQLSHGEWSSIRTLEQMDLDPSDLICKKLAVLVRPGKKVSDEETKVERWVIDEFQKRDIQNLEHRSNLFRTKGKAKDLIPVLDFFLTMIQS